MLLWTLLSSLLTTSVNGQSCRNFSVIPASTLDYAYHCTVENSVWTTWDPTYCQNNVHGLSNSVILRGDTVTETFFGTYWIWSWVGLTRNSNLTQVWTWSDGLNSSQRVPNWDYSVQNASRLCSTINYFGKVYPEVCTVSTSFICELTRKVLCLPNLFERFCFFVVSMCSVDCPRGTQGIAGSCSRCPLGKFNDVTTGTTCQNCAPGKFADSTGSSTCKSCPVGTYSSVNGSRVCSLCELGKYSDSSSVTSCVSCPSGIYTQTAGSNSFSDCNVCAAGFSTTDGVQCNSCPAGRFSGLNATACSCCEAGTYSDEHSTSCTECPTGKWTQATCQSHLSSCRDCPAIAQVSCLSTSLVPYVGPGYYRSLTDPGTISACTPAEACQSTGYGNTTCNSRYSGSVCSSCNTDFFRASGRCVKCISKLLRWSIVGASLVILFVIMFGVSSSNRANIPNSFRIALFWFQFLSIFPSISDVWPETLLSVLNFANFFNVDFGYIGVSCDFTIAYAYFLILALKILMPGFFFLISFFQSWILKKMGRQQTIPWQVLLSNTLFVTMFFSIQLFGSMFQIFNCVPAPRNQTVIAQEPSIICASFEWIMFAVFDIMAIIFYVIFLPVISYRMYRSGEERFAEQVIKPLTKFYKPGSEWFEIVRMASRFLFVLARDALGLSNAGKIAFLSVLVMILLWIESRYRPYAEQTQQDLSLL
jgi:hypothetical protein